MISFVKKLELFSSFNILLSYALQCLPFTIEYQYEMALNTSKSCLATEASDT